LGKKKISKRGGRQPEDGVRGNGGGKNKRKREQERPEIEKGRNMGKNKSPGGCSRHVATRLKKTVLEGERGKNTPGRRWGRKKNLGVAKSTKPKCFERGANERRESVCQKGSQKRGVVY